MADFSVDVDHPTPPSVLEFPTEIICMIFDHYLGGRKVFNDVMSMKSGPGIHLSHVSRNWRRASWSYAPFWSRLLFRFPQSGCPCRSVQTEDFETINDTLDETDDGWFAWYDFMHSTELNVAKARIMLNKTEVPSNMPRSQARDTEIEPPHLDTLFHAIGHLPCSLQHEKQADFLDFILSLQKPLSEIHMGNFAPFGPLLDPGNFGYGEIWLVKRISHHLNSSIKLTMTPTLLKYLSPEIQYTGLGSLRRLEFHLPQRFLNNNERSMYLAPHPYRFPVGCANGSHVFRMAPYLDTVKFSSVPPFLFSFRYNNLRYVAYSGPCLSDCLMVLLCCRNLESFIFQPQVEAEPVDSWDPAHSIKVAQLHTKRQIECANLIRLVVVMEHIGEYALAWVMKILSLLGSLQLPALKELTISGYTGRGWDHSVVNRLLERSGCSLTKLNLSCLDIPTEQLQETFDMSPNLMILELTEQIRHIAFRDPILLSNQLMVGFMWETFLPNLTSLRLGWRELGIERGWKELRLRDHFPHHELLSKCLEVRVAAFHALGEECPLRNIWIDFKEVVHKGILDREGIIAWAILNY